MALGHLHGHRELYLQLVDELRRRPSHAYLFSGPRGVGKRLVAEALIHGLLCERAPGVDFCCNLADCAKRAALGAKRGSSAAPQPDCACCSGCVQVAMETHPDLIVIQRPANRTEILIEQIRDLIGRIALRPIRGDRRVALIDDAETLNLPSQNALLKTLEEPPGHAIIFLVTQSERALLETVRSRLRPVRFAHLPSADLAAILRTRGGVESARADALARLARGSAAHALDLVEGAEPPIKALLEALKNAAAIDFPAANALASELFANRESAGENFELLARLLQEMLSLKVLGLAPEAVAPELSSLMADVAGAFSTEAILISLDLALAAVSAVEANANPRLQAELWLSEVGRLLRGN